MKLTGTLTLWTTVLALSSRAQEAECNYYDGHDRCLNPDATASVTIDIKPLFSSPPTLVYAIDNLTDTQIAIEDDKYGDGIWWRSNYKGGQIQKIGFWMEYDEDSLNYTESSERTYQLAVIFTRSPNSIGGSDGGCEQLLGSECVDGLRDTFRWNGIGYDNWPDLMKRPLRNISCPMDIFEDDLLLSSTGLLGYYAIESSDDGNLPHRPRPAGSARNTTSRIEVTSSNRFRTFEQQRNTAAVVVSVVTPQDLDDDQDHIPRHADAVVSFACARPGPGGSGPGDEADGEDPEGGDGDEDDDDGSGSSMVEAGLTTSLVIGLYSLALFFM